MLPVMALLITSGAMFPLSALPEMVQKIASVFPLKWMAQGLRSALLPDAARAAEPAGSWELPTVALILTAWAVLGFLLAIPLLRRAARRESGSRLAERHRKASLSGGGGSEGETPAQAVSPTGRPAAETAGAWATRGPSARGTDGLGPGAAPGGAGPSRSRSQRPARRLGSGLTSAFSAAPVMPPVCVGAVPPANDGVES